MPTEAFFKQYPPFPDNVPCIDLPRLSYQKLISNEKSESGRLWEAAINHGFFLLDLSTADGGVKLLEDITEVFQISREFFALPFEEKNKYPLQSGIIGYKPLGAMQLAGGKTDLTEIFALSRDSIHDATDNNIPQIYRDHRAFLSTIVDRLHLVAHTVLRQLALRAEIPTETMDRLHDVSEPSTSMLRFLHYPPQDDHAKRQTSLLGHTDSGSLTVLFGAIGGLQILPADAEDKPENWRWVKPEANCAIINLADTMVQWTGGLLRSNFHRVYHAPGDQSAFDRYSFGYFLKPNNTAPMQRIQEGNVIPKLSPEEKDADAAVEPYRAWHIKKNQGLMRGENNASRGGLPATVK